MILKEIKYFPYKLKFKQSLQSASTEFSEKNILFIMIADEFGNAAFGKSAPLTEVTG